MMGCISFITILFISSFGLCQEKKDRFGVEWCFERSASSDQNQLRCLRSLEETQIVKDGIADILQRKHTCPKCKPAIIDGDKFLSFYRYSFLVIQAKIFTRSGGTEVNLIFKKGPMLIIQAFLTRNIEKNITEFSVIEEEPTTPKDIKLIKKLRGKEFDSFWISPP